MANKYRVPLNGQIVVFADGRQAAPGDPPFSLSNEEEADNKELLESGVLLQIEVSKKEVSK